MFARNPNLKHIALVAGDEVRVAIASILSSEYVLAYQNLKNKTELLLNRKISDGSFNWHLKMLEAGGILTKQPVEGFSLTYKGKEIIGKIKEVMEK